MPKMSTLDLKAMLAAAQAESDGQKEIVAPTVRSGFDEDRAGEARR